MQKNITDNERIERQLEREERRFKEYGCVRRELKNGSIKHFPLSETGLSGHKQQDSLGLLLR